MIREHYRSRILSKLLTPRLGVVFLFLTILMLTLATAAAQGPGIDSRQESDAEELVLRRTHFPDADVVDLLPSQDAYITSNRPGQNYGQDSSLWIGYDLSRTGGGAERPYLKWDLSVVPPSAVINSAEFWFAVSKSTPSSDAAMSVQARHVVASWAENSLTWNSAPAPNNQAVVSGGLITKLTGWQQIDVTSLVKDWRSGAEANNGLVVIGDEQVQNRERSIYSRNTSTIGYRPFLRISYTESSDTTAPTASIVPFSESLIATSQFTVQWTGTDDFGGTGIDYFDVQYDADGDGLSWINWLLHTTNTSATFTGESTKYQFRVRAADKAGNLSSWSAAEEITVDTLPPNIRVLSFFPSTTMDSTFEVQWEGDDGPNGSGLKYSDIFFRQGDGQWTLWISQTTGNSAEFNATIETMYAFIAIGTDNLGNTEPFTGSAESVIFYDLTPPFVEPAAYLPQVFKSSS